MIKDTLDRKILSANFAMGSEAVETFTIRIDCYDLQFLSCEAVDDVTVEARKSGDIPWIDITSSPIDLSADAGTTEDYEIRLTAGTITSFSRVKIPLRVGR